MGLESLDATEVTYRWDRLNPSEMAILHERNLTFDPLSQGDENSYRCTTQTTSPYLTTQPIVLMKTATLTVPRKLAKTLLECNF